MNEWMNTETHISQEMSLAILTITHDSSQNSFTNELITVGAANILDFTGNRNAVGCTGTSY